jgi:hypothetical protein
MPPVSSRTMIMSVPSTSAFLSGDESSRCRVGSHRAQVRVHAQHLADTEQTALGAFVGRGVVEFRQSHGAHQSGVGFERQVDGFLRQRTAGLMNRDSAEQAFAQHESW